MKKKLGMWLAIIVCMLAIPLSVSGAPEKSFKVKVNNSFYGRMVQKGTKWKMDILRPTEDHPFEDRVLHIRASRGKPLKTGFYTFTKSGVLDTRKMFHTLNAEVCGKKFEGEYYFGEENGRLTLKKGGWTTVRGKKYYISNAGRKYVNCWKKGYYLLEDGQIARNMETPDGFFVDCDGHKCSKEEMNLSELKKQLQSMIRGYRGNWSVYVKDLKTGDEVSINDRAMKPASVIKLFVMASVYDSIKKGKIKQDASVNSLLRSMITVSDNESYNALVRRHSKNRNFIEGCKVVNNTLEAMGCVHTEAHSTLHPSSSSFTWDGHPNTASAKDAGMILEKIYKKQLVSAKYSKEMLNLLLGQTRKWKIPAGLPSGVKCANKTGENSSCQNDVAIVFGEKTDYIVCIFAETGEYSGVNGIKAMSSKIYSYLN